MQEDQSNVGGNELTALERQCTGYMQLANVGTELLERFTRSTPEPFARPEIVTRLANMLNLVFSFQSTNFYLLFLGNGTTCRSPMSRTQSERSGKVQFQTSRTPYQIGANLQQHVRTLRIHQSCWC
jgi:hypothetical protein